MDHAQAFALLDDFVDKHLDPATYDRVSAHARNCLECATRVRQLVSVTAAVRRVPREGVEQMPADRLVELLRRLKVVPTKRYDLATPDLLDDLRGLHSESSPVLSVYLDLSPTRRDYDTPRHALHSMLGQALRDIEARADRKVAAARAAAEGVERWMETVYDGTGRGLAIISSPGLGLWRAFRLPVPVRDQAVFADRPFIRPLAVLVEEFERYLVLLLDKREARIYVVFMGEIEDYSAFLDEVVPRPRAGGWSVEGESRQRHHETHVLWHAKRAVETADRLFEQAACRHLLIGGPSEALAELRPHLSARLQDALRGQIATDVDTPPDRMLQLVTEHAQRVERQVEADRVERVTTAALKGANGVLGLEDTLAAAGEKRLMLLIVNANYEDHGWECPNCGHLTAVASGACRLCGAALVARDDVVGRLIDRAFEQGAELDIVRGDASARLAEYGHVGALTRF